MRINLFYPSVALLGLAMFFLFRPPAEDEISFYGFAESNETTVNYNYPIVIDRILVRPGQEVHAGQVLMEVSRRLSKEKLADQEFRIAELKAEERLWREQRQQSMAIEAVEARAELAELDARIEALEREIEYKRSLSEGLTTLPASAPDYQPLRERVARLREERGRKEAAQRLQATGADTELRLGSNPYREQIRRLEAEMAFEEGQKLQTFSVLAPADGLIGNIQVREEEHVPSFSSLLTFYEPHSSLVRGFVHEDQTASVGIGDTLDVYSLRSAVLGYRGRVIGLGSRIVEIPARLRKLPDFKTYGREVVVEIPENNDFLQKEKVGIRGVNH